MMCSAFLARGLLLALACATNTVSMPFDYDRVPSWGYFAREWPYRGTGVVERVSFSIRTPYRVPFSMRMTDATGQSFQKRGDEGSDAWYHHETMTDCGGWELHFGGANDGVLHHPVRKFEIMLHDSKAPAKKGEVLVRDVAFHERMPDAPTLKLAADVGKDEPPKTLDVEIRAARTAFPGGRFAVRWTDWDGAVLATRSADCPSLVSGAVWRTTMPYVVRPEGRNAIFCKAALRWGAGRLRKEGPAWTVPVDANPVCAVDPSSPWGAGIYCQRWGMNEWGFRRMERLVALAQRAGIRWLREQILWYQIERNGVVDFAPYDRIVRMCETNGMSLVELYGGIPKNVGKEDPNWPEVYCETLRRTVRRYRGRVAGWEICNEPNLPWPMTKAWSENYRRVLPMSTKVVHEEDPAARTIGCSASGLGVGFVASLADETFDDVSIHPYRRFVDDRAFLADLADLRTAGKGRDIWITEIGWNSFPGWQPACPVTTLHESASLLARAYMTAASAPGVRAVFVYDFIDDGWQAAGAESHMGIVYDNLVPKPSYRALAKVCRTFARGKPELTVASDGLTIFRMGGKCAVWVNGDEFQRIAVAGRANATNLMDEPVAPEVSGGKCVYLTDSRHPLFFDRIVTVERVN